MPRTNSWIENNLQLEYKKRFVLKNFPKPPDNLLVREDMKIEKEWNEVIDFIKNKKTGKPAVIMQVEGHPIYLYLYD